MPDTRAQIGALIEARAASIRTKNADAVMAQIAPDVLSFDVLVPLANRGAEAVRDRLMRWFDHVVNTGSAASKGIYIKATCANACGDGTCSAPETCASCPADCGGCPATCP